MSVSPVFDEPNMPTVRHRVNPVFMPVDNFFHYRLPCGFNTTLISARISVSDLPMSTMPDIRAIIVRCGGLGPVALATGVSKQAVHKWTRVPIHHVHEIAALSGIPAAELRPDVFKRKARFRVRASQAAA